MGKARFLVSGRVQGVWFRAATQQQAGKLGLDGIARNLPDGRVEVIASGTDQALAALQDWLAEGPPLARVTQVQCHSWDGVVEPGFHTA